MREEPCKTYGHLFPADQHIADAVGAVLSDWNIPECTELEGDIFRISFEGVFSPWTMCWTPCALCFARKVPVKST